MLAKKYRILYKNHAITLVNVGYFVALKARAVVETRLTRQLTEFYTLLLANILSITETIMPHTIIINNSYFTVENNQIKTSSTLIAKAFNKEHKNVLAKISTMGCTPKFTKLHFKLCSKNNALQNGKPQPFYQMDFQGFMLLVMSFVGKKAMKIKEAYINAFDRMTKKLIMQEQALPSFNEELKGKLSRFDKDQLSTIMFSILNMVSQADEHYDLGLFKVTSFQLGFQNKPRIK